MSGILTGSGAPSIAFVTGVNAEMFGQFFLLLGSLCGAIVPAPGFKSAIWE